MAEHQSLITSAFILIPRRIDALSDIRRLGMHINVHFSLFPVEPILFITDVLDGSSSNVFHHIRGNCIRATDLTDDLAGEVEPEGVVDGLLEAELTGLTAVDASARVL